MIHRELLVELEFAKLGSGSEGAVWSTWKQDQDPAKLGQLLTSFRPMIRSVVRKWSGGGVSDQILRDNAEILAVKAFRSYDPGKPASLGTHVFNGMKRLSRVVTSNQNVARIPEHRSQKIGTFQNIRAHLEGELDREPTSAELAETLGWSLKDVNTMEWSLRKDLLRSGDVLADYALPATHASEKQRDLVDFIYYELDSREKLVFEYLTGKYGKPKSTAGEIAKLMGVSDATVSRIRKRIENKIEKYSG